MASFTDQIQQFNPYIQQLPVDEYTRTGMIKQQRYDQGVQRVQQYVDHVAGLPVVGDANKALLEQKLGELKGKLQGVLSADFSKASLQNQIGSLAMQIAKDPAIQASIVAGSQIKAAQQSIEDARKSGKNYSDANAAYLQSALQEYLNASSKEAGLSYNGPTSIHSVTMDMVHKKIQDAIAPLKEAWDSNFDVKFSPDHKIMVSSEDKSLNTEKVKAAISAVLTADDYKAMSISGWYNTLGKSDDEVVNQAGGLATRIANEHKQLKEKYLSYVENTQGMTEEEKLKYRQMADNHENVEKEYTKYTAQLVEKYKRGEINREEIAGDIVRETMMSSYAGAYSFFREGKTEYAVSPYWTIATEEEKLAIERLKIKKEEEEGKTGAFSTPIPVDAQNSNNLTTTQSMQEDISKVQQGIQSGGEIQEQELKESAKALDIDSNGVRQYKLVDEGGNWVSPKARQDAIKRQQDLRAEQLRAAADPNFTGTIPNYNKRGYEAKLQTNVQANVAAAKTRTDNYVEQKVLKENPELAKKIGGTAKIDNVDYKIKDLLQIYYESTTEPTPAMGGAAGPTRLVQARNLIKGSKGDQIGFEKIQKALGEKGFSERELAEKKNNLYKDQAEALQPYEWQIIAPKKVMQGSEYFKYQEIASSSDEVRTAVPGRNVEFDDITIKGFHRDKQGRIMMRASIKDVNGDIYIDMKTKGQDLAKSEATKNWLVTSRFYTDTMPELTDALMKPGSGKKTAGPESGFKGGLFVTGNKNVARNYQIVYDEEAQGFRVFAAQPIGNGKYNMIDITRDPMFPNGRVLTNAGLAKDYVELFYSRVNDKVSVSEVEQEYLKLFYK